MLKLTSRYAKALLEYAEEHGLEDLYRQALVLVLSGNPDPSQTPESLREFLAAVPGGEDEISAVLYAFLDLARERMNLLPVEVISAVPLTGAQLANLEKKLILMFRKQLDMVNTVDPSLLGGLRVIAGDTVLDDSIKRKLMDMKNSVYEGVYFKQ